MVSYAKAYCLPFIQKLRVFVIIFALFVCYNQTLSPLLPPCGNTWNSSTTDHVTSTCPYKGPNSQILTNCSHKQSPASQESLIILHKFTSWAHIHSQAWSTTICVGLYATVLLPLVGGIQAAAVMRSWTVQRKVFSAFWLVDYFKNSKITHTYCTKLYGPLNIEISPKYSLKFDWNATATRHPSDP